MVVDKARPGVQLPAVILSDNEATVEKKVMEGRVTILRLGMPAKWLRPKLRVIGLEPKRLVPG